MPEKPRLRMEINNIASLFTLFISHFFLSLSTLDYWIKILEDRPHTLKSGDMIDIYSLQPHAQHHAHVNNRVTLLRQCFFKIRFTQSQLYLQQVVQTGIMQSANQVKCIFTIPSIIKGKEPKDDLNELLHLHGIN